MPRAKMLSHGAATLAFLSIVLDTGRFLWRLEEFVDRSQAGRGAEMLSLPMMVANKAGVVLFTNEAMRRLLGARPKRMDRVFYVARPTSGEEVDGRRRRRSYPRHSRRG